jgi:hypothetical protein
LKSAFLLFCIHFIEFELELFVLLLTDIKSVAQGLKDVHLQLVNVGGVDASSKLEGLVIVVEVVLKFG